MSAPPEWLAELQDYVRNSAEKRAHGKTRAQAALAEAEGALARAEEQRDALIKLGDEQGEQIAALQAALAEIARQRVQVALEALSPGGETE